MSRFIIVLFLTFLSQEIFCIETSDPAIGHQDDSPEDYSKGLLYGKNMFIPYLIHYNFPSLSAKSGKKFDFQYHTSIYYIQDVQYLEHTDNGIRSYDKTFVVRDYEGCVGEIGFSYHFFDELQLGVDLRLISYYGGFLDETIETFHNIFGFPTGRREFFLQNQIYINIPNDNGIRLFLDAPSVAFGDIDLWGKWTFFENSSISLAALGAFKLPSGRLETLSGSNYPDIGLGILSDIKPYWFFTVYAQAGIVLPLNFQSYPMFNGLIGLEMHPWQFLSLNVQMNIKTSPISNNIGWSWNSAYGTNYKLYSMPQTNILAGFIIKFKDFKWQFYFEEDAITNQGTDITFNIMFSHSLSLQGFQQSTPPTTSQSFTAQPSP